MRPWAKFLLIWAPERGERDRVNECLSAGHKMPASWLKPGARNPTQLSNPSGPDATWHLWHMAFTPLSRRTHVSRQLTSGAEPTPTVELWSRGLKTCPKRSLTQTQCSISPQADSNVSVSGIQVTTSYIPAPFSLKVKVFVSRVLKQMNY